ncbi:MAG: hypothetical protein AAGL11_12585 [Pseudomonadota bacterium]
MRLKLLSSLIIGSGVALCVVIAAVPLAEASPRFTVGNKSDQKLRIEIYNGDDGNCIEPLKTKKSGAYETDTYGCQGNGKGRCKIEIYRGDGKICKSLHDTCSNGAIAMRDDSIVYVFRTPVGYECELLK